MTERRAPEAKVQEENLEKRDGDSALPAVRATSGIVKQTTLSFPASLPTNARLTRRRCVCVASVAYGPASGHPLTQLLITHPPTRQLSPLCNNSPNVPPTPRLQTLLPPPLITGACQHSLFLQNLGRSGGVGQKVTCSLNRKCEFAFCRLLSKCARETTDERGIVSLLRVNEAGLGSLCGMKLDSLTQDAECITSRRFTV